jgi:hypothetical protein
VARKRICAASIVPPFSSTAMASGAAHLGAWRRRLHQLSPRPGMQKAPAAAGAFLISVSE